ncbi:unnamed protein product, partial [Rotaria sp. Silwood1]
PSPSYVTNPNPTKFDSFDHESADEKGILGNGSLSIEKLGVNNSPKLVVPLASGATLRNTVHEKNTMNGLFACDHDSNMYNKSISVFF